MVVQLMDTSHGFNFKQEYNPRGVEFCPGTPFFISFLGFAYIELQIDKLLPNSECRIYLSAHFGQMTTFNFGDV